VSQHEVNAIARAVERARQSRRKGLKFALPTVAALGAGTALAVGAIPSGDGTITGCYLTNTVNAPQLRIGNLRLIDTSQPSTLPTGGPNPQGACLSDEATVSWNQHGPQGPVGPQGPAGGQGAPGAPLIGGTSFGVSGGGKTFLKLDGIKGESIDKTHKGEIDIMSFSFGVSNGGQVGAGGGGGAGKVSFQSFKITKRLDKSSPLLFQATGSGRHFKFADVFFARKAGGKEQDYLEFKFTDVLVSSLQDGQSGHGTPEEQVTFSFHKATETFFAKGPHGSRIPSVSITISGNLKI
jgi:type VI secretion system secreted protein Hcp